MNEQHRIACAGPEWTHVVQNFMLPWALDGLPEGWMGPDLIEIGPGPGATTDVLRTMAHRLTAIELDAALAHSLAERLAGTNVEVHEHDATDLRFPDGTFSAGTCFTMLHHVPEAALQDRVLAELVRVVRPDGWVVGSDSVAGDDLAALHEGDVYNPIDPEGLAERLQCAGLVDVEVAVNDSAFRFRGRVAARLPEVASIGPPSHRIRNASARSTIDQTTDQSAGSHL